MAQFSLEEKKPEKPKHGLFGKSKEQPGISQNFSADIVTMSRRLRTIEERYDNIRKKTQVTDQNMLKFNKEIRTELKAMNSDLVEARREFLDLRDKVRLMVKELKDCAKTEDIKVLENYINMWEPINFVTRNDVKKIVEDVLEEKQNL